jgi:hypothetical protein
MNACRYDPDVSNEFAFEIYMIFALPVNKLSGSRRLQATGFRHRDKDRDSREDRAAKRSGKGVG